MSPERRWDAAFHSLTASNKKSLLFINGAGRQFESLKLLVAQVLWLFNWMRSRSAAWSSGTDLSTIIFQSSCSASMDFHSIAFTMHLSYQLTRLFASNVHHWWPNESGKTADFFIWTRWRVDKKGIFCTNKLVNELRLQLLEWLPMMPLRTQKCRKKFQFSKFWI